MNYFRTLLERWAGIGGASEPAPAAEYEMHMLSRRFPLAYRVLPKCGSSTVAQIIHYLDYGKFYPGKAHQRPDLILKWQGNDSDKAEIVRRFAGGQLKVFTFARNPFTRIASAYLDKVVPGSESGRYYRGGVPRRAAGIPGADTLDAEQAIRYFPGFLRMAERACDLRRPQSDAVPDRHWQTCVHHLVASLKKAPGWQLDHVGRLETFKDDMQVVYRLASVPESMVPGELPRENKSRKDGLSKKDLWTDECVSIVMRTYADDFDLFGYAADPDLTVPQGAISAEIINHRLKGMLT